MPTSTKSANVPAGTPPLRKRVLLLMLTILLLIAADWTIPCCTVKSSAGNSSADPLLGSAVVKDLDEPTSPKGRATDYQAAHDWYTVQYEDGACGGLSQELCFSVWHSDSFSGSQSHTWCHSLFVFFSFFLSV